jgi:predicted site-specific integrase-resolvase
MEAIYSLLTSQKVEKEWYSTSELAETLDKSHYTIQERWCNEGRIECEKDPESGKWRIPGHEFRRLVGGGALKPRRR